MGVVSSHPTDKTLLSYGLGKLDDVSSRSVSKHLEGCATCQRRVAEMSSDPFLDRHRGAQSWPDQAAADWAPRSRSVTDLRSGASVVPPLADTIPPELADHPDYEVLRELGRGGMGVVYLTRNKLMGRPEVLKFVYGHLLEQPGVRERFLREIQSAAKLQHKNIVAAYSAMRLGANIVLAMEYVEGDDLAKVVKTYGPLPVANACYVIYQAALGLQHAHERGMVHRDIKPANLILAREGTAAVVKVLDFGLAKVTREGRPDSGLTRVGQMMGTPEFIAPEQIRNTQSADIRADIYSLGCTFYYLLTGGPPFRSEHVWDVYQAHFSMIAGPLNLVRPEVPVELAALVAKMMAKAPARRFQTPAEVAQAIIPFFQKALTGGGLSSADASQVRRQGPPRESGEVRPMSAQSGTNAAPVSAPAIRNQAAATRPDPAWESLIKFKETETLREPALAAQRLPKPWLWSAAVGAVLLVLAVAWALAIVVKTPMGVIVLENVPKNAVVEVDGDTIRVIPAVDQLVTIESKTGKHVVVVKRGSEVLLAESVTLETGKHFKLTVRPAAPTGKRVSPH